MRVDILSHGRFPPFGFQNGRPFNIGISIISIVLHGMCCNSNKGESQVLRK